MKLTSMPIRWTLLILVACSWMSMGALSECDPQIASDILDGVGAAVAGVADVLITALFDAMKPQEQTPVTTTKLLSALPAEWLS